MIPSDTTDLITAQSTHEGETGKNNEDRAIVGAFRDGAASVTLAMVADGIGGHVAGEIASDLAVRTVYDYLERSDSRDPLGLLQSALLAANQAIYERSRSDPQLQGMGSTAVVALLVGRKLYGAHVGDSRMYLIRAGAIRQLTVDHTWVQEAISAGLLTPEDARKHPNRHVIRRYLGHDLDSDPVDLGLQYAPGETPEQMARNQGLRLEPGDMLLLCSDGLTDLVLDEEILAALLDLPPQEATEQLTLLARQRGGFDNITIVLVKAPPQTAAGAAAPTRLAAERTQLAMPAAAPAAAPTARPRRRRRALMVTLLVLGALVLVAATAGVAGLLYFNSGNARPLPAATATLAPTAIATAGAALPPAEPEASATPAAPATEPAAPTETAAAPAAGQAYVTADNDATVRLNPDPAALALGDLLQGATARVYGRDPDGLWWYIDFPPGTASRGWIFRTAATLTGEVDAIPVVNAQGTPESSSEDTGGGPAGATATPQG